MATGPAKFSSRRRDITIREYKPYAVKVDVQPAVISFRVTVETDSAADLVLHWGVATARARAWLMARVGHNARGHHELAEVDDVVRS